ncbi:unnamed protein product, partial [Amoebophrya sp. A25]
FNNQGQRTVTGGGAAVVLDGANNFISSSALEANGSNSADGNGVHDSSYQFSPSERKPASSSGDQRFGFSYFAHQMHPRSPLSGAQNLRLLSYNLWLQPPLPNSFHTNGCDDFKFERLERFMDKLQGFQIMALQEVYGSYSDRRDRLA